jgi:hypothetical protein
MQLIFRSTLPKGNVITYWEFYLLPSLYIGYMRRYSTPRQCSIIINWLFWELKFLFEETALNHEKRYNKFVKKLKI